MIEGLLLAGSLPLLVACLLLAGMGVPIPEDPVLLAAGALAQRTSLPWWRVLVTVYAAAIGADTGLFALARWFGEPLLGVRPFRWFLTAPRRAKVHALFAARGSVAVFIGRHLAGFRSLVFVVAGIERMPWWRFVLWDALAGMITIPAMFGAGYLFSSHVDAVQRGVARIEHWLTAVAVAVALVAFIVWSRRQPPLRD